MILHHISMYLSAAMGSKSAGGVLVKEEAYEGKKERELYTIFGGI